MEPVSIALIVLAVGIAAIAVISLVRSRRPNAVATVQSSLARLEARLDEHSRSRVEQASALRKEIGQSLASGLQQTNRIHTDVVERLALIDEAQKRIAELSSDIVSLQEILADRSSRGAFGEVQLQGLVSNMLPPSSYRIQHTLSNGKRADCMLFLPPPTGNIAIDSKFPLSNFRRKVDPGRPESERHQASRNFARDVRAHVDAVAAKYIVPGETCDGAVLFIPAEAVFADIHSSYPGLVDHAHRKNVWLTSPTTLMAVLTTARSVLRDEAASREVHTIQEHLQLLAEDFERFEARMDKLAGHTRMAMDDAKLVLTSCRKITARFKKINQLD